MLLMPVPGRETCLPTTPAVTQNVSPVLLQSFNNAGRRQLNSRNEGKFALGTCCV